MVGMKPGERIEFSTIEKRPNLTLSDGGRIIVWPILALEVWNIDRAMARMVISPPQGEPMTPDHPNWSWHEYGMRAGVWRQFKALTDRNIRATVAINGNVCNSYPRVAGFAKEMGWEFMGHGFLQGLMQKQRQIKMKTIKIVSKTGLREPFFQFLPIFKFSSPPVSHSMCGGSFEEGQ